MLKKEEYKKMEIKAGGKYKLQPFSEETSLGVSEKEWNRLRESFVTVDVVLGSHVSLEGSVCIFSAAVLDEYTEEEA